MRYRQACLLARHSRFARTPRRGRLEIKLLRQVADLLRPFQTPVHRLPCSASEACRKAGTFAPPQLPGFPATMALSRLPAGSALLAADGGVANSTRRDLPFRTAVSLRRPALPTTPAERTAASVGCFPARAAFPVSQAGRRPRFPLRGLLRSRLPQGVVAPRRRCLRRVHPSVHARPRPSDRAVRFLAARRVFDDDRRPQARPDAGRDRVLPGARARNVRRDPHRFDPHPHNVIHEAGQPSRIRVGGHEAPWAGGLPALDGPCPGACRNDCHRRDRDPGHRPDRPTLYLDRGVHLEDGRSPPMSISCWPRTAGAKATACIAAGRTSACRSILRATWSTPRGSSAPLPRPLQRRAAAKSPCVISLYVPE